MILVYHPHDCGVVSVLLYQLLYYGNTMLLSLAVPRHRLVVMSHVSEMNQSCLVSLHCKPISQTLGR